MRSVTVEGRDLFKTGAAKFVLKAVEIQNILEPKIMARDNLDQEYIDELARNIKQVGLINPITVKKSGGKYEIVAGHMRYLALKLLGVKSTQVHIINEVNNTGEIIKLSENLIRQDLNDVEEAVMIINLQSLTKLDDDKMGLMLGKSKSYIRQKLAILKYRERLREALRKGEISFSVSRELHRIKNENLQSEYLRHSINGGATPALVKEWVDQIMYQQREVDKEFKSEDDNETKPAFEEVKFQCYLCGKVTDLINSKLYRIDNNCVKELQSGG